MKKLKLLIVEDETLVAFKRQLVSALAPAATAVLLDPQYGVAQCVASGGLPGQVGLLTSVEASGYTGDPQARQSGILPGWSVAKARRMGASAIKLLVYYHPEAPTAPEIEQPMAPAASAPCLTSTNPGMSTCRCGSITTSSSDSRISARSDV